MKCITLLISIILFSTCKMTKQEANPEKKALAFYENPTTQNDILFEYSAINRGSFLYIKIENMKLAVQKKQHGEHLIKDLSNSEWQILMDDVHAISLDSISTLKAPTNKRAHDGAASARLKVITGDLIYSTTEFDHGNPNQYIKPLVDYILSLAENVE